MIQKEVLLLILIAARRGDGAGEMEERGQEERWQQHQQQQQQQKEAWPAVMDAVLGRLTDGIEAGKCRRQMKAFQQSLANWSLWAVEMLDANAKIPQSLLSSDAFDPGNYDGCLRIDLKRELEDNIFGRYCLATLSLSQPACLKEGTGNGEGHEPLRKSEMAMLDQLIVALLRYGFENNGIRLGVCIPHECSATDVESMLLFLYNNVTKINCEIGIRIPENGCITAFEKHESTLGTFISRTFLAMFLGVTLVTILQVCSISHRFRLPGFVNRFVIPFSAYQNYKMLVFEHFHERLPVVDSLKVCSMILLTVIRRFALMLESPLLNRRYVNELFPEKRKQTLFAVAHDIIAVTVLVISGFLHHRNATKKFLKTGSTWRIWRTCLLQFLKLIPAYLSSVLFFAFEFQQVGDGPLWMENSSNSTAMCREALLKVPISGAKLLEINSKCIFESWYFAAIALHFVMIPAVMRSSCASWTSLGLLAGAWYLMMTDEPVNGIETSRRTKGEYGYMYLTLEYAFPYIVGIGTSIIYEKLNGKKNRPFMRKVMTIISQLFAILFPVGLLWIYFEFNAVQLTTEKNCKWRQITWSLIVSWLIVEGSTGHIRCLSPVLKNRYLTFFGFFTYPYIHILGLIQVYTTGTARTLGYFSYSRLAWMSLADVVSTYIFAFVFYMMLHRPLSKMLEEEMLKDKNTIKNALTGSETSTAAEDKVTADSGRHHNETEIIGESITPNVSTGVRASGSIGINVPSYNSKGSRQIKITFAPFAQYYGLPDQNPWFSQRPSPQT